MQRRYVTTSIPKFGKAAFGFGEYASNEAARRGEIPTIQIGRRKVVPVAEGERMLGVEPGALDNLLDALDNDQASPSTDDSPDGDVQPLDAREQASSQPGR